MYLYKAIQLTWKTLNPSSVALPPVHPALTGSPLLSGKVFFMKEIKLTQGKVALVDDEDFEYLNQWRWCAAEHHGNYYAIRSEYINGRKYKTIRMHRLIIGAKKGEQVDHINHDGLCNIKSNLRICTALENANNRKVVVNRKGGVKYLNVCVTGRPNSKPRFLVDITYNKKRYYGGTFDTQELAAKKADEMMLNLKGEFANLNFK